MDYMYASLTEMMQRRHNIKDSIVLTGITAGQYRFEFVNMDLAKTHDLVEKLNDTATRCKVPSIMHVVRCCRELRIHVRLTFHATADKTPEENLEDYTGVFLPIYKKLRDMKYIENV